MHLKHLPTIKFIDKNVYFQSRLINKKKKGIVRITDRQIFNFFEMVA